MTIPGLIEADLGPRARGYFTSRGAGASRLPAPIDAGYAGLNLADRVGDDPAHVAACRAWLESTVGLEGGDIAWMNQVHSDIIAHARRGSAPTADALILDARAEEASARSPRGAGVLVADCVPLLLASADGRLVAAVHAGRRGMLGGVVPRTVEEMTRLGADPSGISAAIGPSICGRCYEVPGTMRDEAAAVEPACASTTSWGTPGLDVAAGVIAQLQRSGVARIAPGEWCTFEDERFFSYRREGTTGRLAGIVLTTI
ncbi:peptidoglycan editing factor PgeF [Actinomyces gaoshouyii]|uniref:Purine nucleoside phosphorylase n=1 Tax=Actinomyces gaoshouyii TaxID=1960083 RepID=A0A8H9HAE8_9ACTO|nr:peptidoglycan editing factor PgeF [Actinomyces gaoshouyii]GGO99943.1 laccase domain protein [Actinomyces gaoshouyii]